MTREVRNGTAKLRSMFSALLLALVNAWPKSCVNYEQQLEYPLIKTEKPGEKRKNAGASHFPMTSAALSSTANKAVY